MSARRSSAARQRVLVYGTLRRGGRYHPLLAHAVYLGRHTTEPAYSMLDLGTCPGVIDAGRTAIRGEVYLVNAKTLAALDAFEDYPWEYTRRRIATAHGAAWIYLYLHPRDDHPRIACGDWTRRKPRARTEYDTDEERR